MLKQRILTALVLVTLAGAAIWFDEPLPWFTVLAGTWALLAMGEFYHIASLQGVQPQRLLSLAMGLLIIISPHLGAEHAQGFMLSLAVVVTLIALLFRPQKEGAFRDWCWGLAGILYISWLASYFVALRIMPEGRNWVLFTIIVIASSDIGAFFIGRAWGNHRLAPRISPRKTWEGAIGGILIGIGISLIFTIPRYGAVNNALYLSGLTWPHALALAAVITTLGGLGDLVESLFKRNAGVKDSAQQALPGHGGFLDRLDSLLFSGVAVYYYVQWFVT